MSNDELDSSYQEYVKRQGGVAGAARALALNYVKDIYSGQPLDLDTLDNIFDNALKICSKKLEDEKKYGSNYGV